MNTKTKDKPTAAAVPPPRQKRAGHLDAIADAPVVAAQNMPESNLVNINFKVSSEYRARFKQTATTLNISMKTLMEGAFDTFSKALSAGEVDLNRLQQRDFVSKTKNRKK